MRLKAIVLSLLVWQSAGNCVMAMQMELRPQIAKQGEVVQVILKDWPGSTGGTDAADGAPPPVVLFRDKTFKTYPCSHSAAASEEGASAASLDTDFSGGAKSAFRALIGVPADLAPGSYKIKVANTERTLRVVDAGFGVQVISLPKAKDNFNGSPGEEAAVDSAKATLSPHQYWQGRFLRPSQARISSPFGLRRRVNGVLLKDYFHSGLDFAGSSGSPVLATQAGKVVLAHQGWKLHGNIICIDHGQGVVSFYIHLSRILVKEGDMVKAGEKIGTVGSTGRANGPHLHFSVYVNKEASNPGCFFNNSF